MNIFNALMPIIALSMLAQPAAARTSTPPTAPEEEENRGFHGTTAVGVGVIPEYEGADAYRIIPLSNGRAYLDRRYIELDGLALRANLLNNSRIAFGPVAHLTFGRRDRIGSTAVAQLGRINDAYEFGAFVATTLPLGKSGDLRLALEGVHDVAQVHNGWIGTASIGYHRRLSTRWLVSGTASVSGASDDYARRYFTVTPQGSAASGLAAFNARGGIKDVGISVRAAYKVNERWSIQGVAGYKRLLGDFAQSPVVGREGNANQLSGGLGIGFHF
ncbi:MAG: hypothetical protein C0465_26335 [Ralstonia sp.]|uniref:MipA/OmpV family protein n=1 Tax=Ralstonia sp. TaxID=54061 RepID=UPI00257C038A|nr:MipA/OmpV family protein [Ralstonia sp.]MBA4234094.1 hypothetical protein [Ralstonia sp.]